MPSNIVKGWKKSGDTQRADPSTVIAKFTKVHGSYYDYSKMVYIRNRDNVEIICPVHGSFWQSPRTHKEGGNCPQCAIKMMAKGKQLTTEEAIAKFAAVHGSKYDYSGVQYSGMHNKVDITCPKHGKFTQTPTSHKKGSGCPRCGKYGFQPMRPAIMYYVRVDVGDSILYKIGITNRSVVERFGADMRYITVLQTWDYELGADAYAAEQVIISLNAEFKYTGPNILATGNTELFTIDVGGFDNE